MTYWDPDFEVSVSDSEEENGDDDSLKPIYFGREAIIFIVDANLYEQLELLKQSLNIIRGAFLSGLLVDDKDLMGLVFANTARSPQPYEPNCLDNIHMPNNCSVFLPPHQLTKAIVEHFLNFLETVETQFGEKYGVTVPDGYGNFSDMLRLCLDMVRTCNYNLDNVTLIYITHRCSPQLPDSDAYAQALHKAADLKDREIDFKLIPMVDDFDYDVFYKEFLSLVRDESMDSFEPDNAQQLRGILANRKIKQSLTKRSLGHFKFYLGPDLALSAKYFNYFQKRKAPRKILIQRTDNAIVHRKRIITVFKEDPVTMECVDRRAINITDAHYEINLGNETVRLSTALVNRVRNLHTPQMMLLGFKPKTEMANVIFCKPCNFMYPDDGNLIGSKRLFRALWERCRARDKVAICLFMCKRKSMPRYVALVPVAKEDAKPESHYSLLVNDGFKIVYLPFATYIRHIDFGDWNSIENHATDAAEVVMEKLVRKFRLKFNPNNLCDPSLDELQTKLLALAFNIESDTAGSQYFPDTAVQDEVVANILLELQSAFASDLVPATKRSNIRKIESSVAKQPKFNPDNLHDKNYIQQLVESRLLNNCKKEQLLQILKQHFATHLPQHSKKQDLLNHIYSLEFGDTLD